MNIIAKESQDIIRLRVPFEELYTSVFLVRAEGGLMLVDCATTAEDVDEYIVPSILKLGYRLSEVRTIVITHHHSDHDGGLERILELVPNIRVIDGISELAPMIKAVPLPGHTTHCIGLLDERCGTLISGDGLQGAGVGKYRCLVQDKAMYLDTLRRLKSDERIKKILFSHAYEPWYKDSACGREEILYALDECAKYIGEKL